MNEDIPQDMWQSRTERLLGPEGVKRLADARVLVMGVGGVGSWTAEALVRSSLGHITMVDADCVAPSNINRQLMATTATVGERKVEALRRRLLEINPAAEVEALDMEYNESTAAAFDLERYDCVIDAIDSIASKALLICEATRRKVPLLSSMGAALKLDPSRIRSGWFTDVSGCRLAAALRRRFKRTGVYPARRFMCVWSDELVPNRGMDSTASADTSMSYGKVSYNGSMCHITAIFGMTLAGMCIRRLVK